MPITIRVLPHFFRPRKRKIVCQQLFGPGRVALARPLRGLAALTGSDIIIIWYFHESECFSIFLALTSLILKIKPNALIPENPRHVVLKLCIFMFNVTLSVSNFPPKRYSVRSFTWMELKWNYFFKNSSYQFYNRANRVFKIISHYIVYFGTSKNPKSIIVASVDGGGGW